MKIPWTPIDTKEMFEHMPWLAWIILAMAILMVSIGVCVSLIKFGSVQFKSEAVKKATVQAMEYSQEGAK